MHAKQPSSTYRNGSLNKPAKERLWGDSLTRKDGVWRRMERVFDRENDLYEETVWNPDGSIHHHQREPLSEHEGHGSAKGKPS